MTVLCLSGDLRGLCCRSGDLELTERASGDWILACLRWGEFMIAALDLTTVVVGATVVDIVLVDRVVVAAVTEGVFDVVDVGVVVAVFVTLVLPFSDDAIESLVEDEPDLSAEGFFVDAIPGDIADSLTVGLGRTSLDSLVDVGFGVVGLESLIGAVVDPVDSLLVTAVAGGESLVGESVTDVESLLIVFVCVTDDSLDDSAFVVCDALEYSLLGTTRA